MVEGTAFLEACTRSLKNGFRVNFTSLNTLVFVYLTLRITVDGLEEYIIQPTAWYYMEYLGEPHVFLGLTMAAYSIGTLIFSPFIGFFEMKFQASKAIVLTGGLVKFFGNVLYSVPVNGYFPLFGRFISGVGEGTVGVLYGAVAKCTTNKNRAQAFLYFEGLYSLGTIVGPSIGKILQFNLNILGWEINAGNSPGVVLAFFWFLLLILTLFLPRHIAENSIVRQSDGQLTEEDSDHETSSSQAVPEDSQGFSPSAVFCVYYLIFLAGLANNVVLFYLPLLAVHHLGVHLSHVESMYINTSLFVVAIYLTAYIFADKISEKKLLFMLIVFTIVPISIIFNFARMWNSVITVNGAYFLQISMIIVNTGSAGNFPSACSLISKITPTSDAAFYQSLSFTTAHVAIIAGRLIAGATFAKTPMMFSCLGLAIAWAFGTIWLVIEYKHLPPKA